MKVTAIINPKAGGNYASEIYKEVLEQFREFDLSYLLTEKQGDAISMAKNAVEQNADYIVCIGGDGTLNEVVQSMVHSNTALVPISAGTGSDFIKSLHFTDLDSIKDAMSSNSVVEIDLGLAATKGVSRYFINILEVGFGASVMKRVNSRKKSRSSFSFTSSVLALLPFFKPFKVHLSIEKQELDLDLAELVVANGQYFGGGMHASPGALLDDGLLNVHVVSGVGKLQMISKLGKLRNGSYIDDPVVSSYLTDNLLVTGNAPVEIDGEDFGELPLKVTLVNKCLKIVSPQVKKN